MKRLAVVAVLIPAVALLLLWIVAAFNLARAQGEASALQRFYEHRDNPDELKRFVSRHDANWRNLYIGACSTRSCADSIRISAYPQGIAQFLYTHKLGWAAPSFWWFSQEIFIKNSKLIDAEQGLTASSGRYGMRVTAYTNEAGVDVCIPLVAKLRRYRWEDNFLRWGFASLGVHASMTSTIAGAFDFRMWCLLSRCFDPRRVNPVAFERFQQQEAREKRFSPEYDHWPSDISPDAEPMSEGAELTRAEKGDPTAQWTHGMNLIEEKRAGEGMMWLRKAAAQRHNAALIWLGLFYMNGEHVPQDHSKGFRLMETAAKQGSTIAMTKLGAFYLYGWGTHKSATSAAQWFERSAAKSKEDNHHILGSTRAMSRLCQMDLDGERKGIALDVTLRLCEEAAKRGERTAQYRLAQLYDDGGLVPKNPGKAFGWYRAAALFGNLDASDRLADFYRNGIVADQNDFQAYVWSQLAADGPLVQASRLNPAEIKSAETCISNQRETNKHWDAIF